MNVANSKISVYNWVVVGLLAITFIVFAKMLLTRFRVPGLSEVVQAV